jgi:hypothetical protein
MLPMFGIALTYLDNNELLSIAYVFTWLLSTIYQIIDIKRDWRIMYIYEHGFVVEDLTITRKRKITRHLSLKEFMR